MKVDLLDPSLFERGEFWPVLAWLRANDPVHRHAEPDGPGFWVVSRYEDIVGVYGDQESFSSRYGMRLDSDAEAVSAVAQRMLIVSDPPDHTHLKRVLGKMFAQAELAQIEHLVRRVVRDVLTEAVEAGELDFLDAAKKIPNHVVCSLMDIPRGDWEWVGEITTEAFEGGDEETRQGAHGEIFLYFTELLADRRKNPGSDFVSRVALDRRATDVPGQERPLSDEEIVFNCNGVLAGANETTRYSAAGGVLALIENPGQWAALRADGPAAVPSAVEEVLRWTVPGVHAMRTALRPTTIGGVRIAVGDRVTLWNVSANRDETVFAHADRFDVGRSPNRHISFGAGRHLCLGARLARMELNMFLTELIGLVDRMELLGEPKYNASNFTWGICSLPLRLVP
ncbi:cytochrome P450 [Streptomyces sp. NBC_01217]|uniref:cytochrome P450 n=1 Tax=Streptomyces sp. NBC_01217 TaxID=2903779 RepID=UPI002E0D8A87|nr:cytochrome P450 [Streptomyces sp. NBC_01217]